MVKKARAAGSFLGGIANNPGIIIIGLALGALLIFRKDITNFLDKGIGNITLPEIKLPDIKFPEFNFPEFKFPDLPPAPDFSGLFQQFQQQQNTFLSGLTNLFGGGEIPKPTKMVEDTGLDPLASCQCGASIVQDAFGNVNVTCKQCAAVDTQLPSQIPAENIPQTNGFVGGIGGGLLGFLGLTPAQQFVQDKIEDESLPAGFSGGGLSFIGGSIFQTPIANLSLSQIIDQFGVTASQAANIKAIAADDFGDFNFGTNTGSGIGSIFQNLSLTSLLPSSNVSDSQFQGLSAQEIANLLTGGNIQNF